MTKVGYARVSSAGQKLDAQADKLQAYGCDRIYQEKVSGMEQHRPQLNACLGYLREGDTLIITKLDRLARSAVHLGKLVEDFQRQGIHFVVIDQAIDTSQPMGKLMFHMLSAFAEFEHNLRRERQIDGIRQAQAAGVAMGRPRTLTDEMAEQIKADRQAGQSITQIMETYGVSKSTIYRIL